MANKEQFFNEPMPVVKNDAVVLDDSDEEDQVKTDSSEESEIEFEMGETENVAKLIENRFLELDIDNQIKMGIDNVSTRYKKYFFP